MITEKNLLDFINKTVGDPNYQTIELSGKRVRGGYSKSWITWSKILETGISFANKTVADIGCFLGYFCFKSKLSGAKEVVGFDKNIPALNGAKKIAEHTSASIEFKQKNIGKEKVERKFDVILALNMLHHVRKDYGGDAYSFAINNIFESCSEVIFEVNEDELSTIHDLSKQNDFSLINKIVSHRKTQYGNRSILYYKKV